MTLEDFRSSLNRGAPSPGAHTALMLIWPICGDAGFGSEPGFDFALQCPVSVLVKTYYMVSISISIETFSSESEPIIYFRFRSEPQQVSILVRNLCPNPDKERRKPQIFSAPIQTKEEENPKFSVPQFRPREKKTPNCQRPNSNKERVKPQFYSGPI